MQVRAVLGPSQGLIGAEKQAQSVGLSSIGQRLSTLWHQQIQPPHKTTWDWNSVKIRLLHVLELLPDATTVIDALKTLSVEYGYPVPRALKVVYATAATFSTILIPRLLFDLVGLLTVALPKGFSKGPRLDHSINLTCLTTFAATLVAVGADGIREICEMIDVPYGKLERVIQAIFPWVPYVLRISMVVQLIDLCGGVAFQKEIARSLRDRVHAEPSWKRLGYAALFALRHPLIPLSRARHVKAQETLSVIREHRPYVRRANGGIKGLKFTVTKLEQELHSWNPYIVYRAVGKTERLTTDLRLRSVHYIRNQAFGFGANLFALLTLMMTHTVGIAVLSIVSASYYWAQTSHGWFMPPSASLRHKSVTGEEVTLWRVLQPAVEVGRWMTEKVGG